jgi:hypothetical protein
MTGVDVRLSSYSAPHPYPWADSRLAVPHPSLPVVPDPSLVMLIAVQHPAPLQMAPVLEVSPRAPAGGAKGVLGLAHG